MKFRGSVSTLACCLAFVLLGATRIAGQESDYPRPSPPAQQPPTDHTTLTSQTQETQPTHGHPADTNPGRNARDPGHGAEIAGIATGVAATLVDLRSGPSSRGRRKA
ncbi:MAG: hypothetical protein ABSF71_36605 [Terriglobia bacterium]